MDSDGGNSEDENVADLFTQPWGDLFFKIIIIDYFVLRMNKSLLDLFTKIYT